MEYGTTEVSYFELKKLTSMTQSLIDVLCDTNADVDNS
jgi:hypothetical protein